jgi:hypothetical protein
MPSKPGDTHQQAGRGGRAPLRSDRQWSRSHHSALGGYRGGHNANGHRRRGRARRHGHRPRTRVTQVAGYHAGALATPGREGRLRPQERPAGGAWLPRLPTMVFQRPGDSHSHRCEVDRLRSLLFSTAGRVSAPDRRARVLWTRGDVAQRIPRPPPLVPQQSVLLFGARYSEPPPFGRGAFSTTSVTSASCAPHGT